MRAWSNTHGLSRTEAIVDRLAEEFKARLHAACNVEQILLCTPAPFDILLRDDKSRDKAQAS